MKKISISVTDEHARLVEEAVESGDYTSVSEVYREAIREWKARRHLGQLFDEGLASGFSEPQPKIEEIKTKARLQSKR